MTHNQSETDDSHTDRTKHVAELTDEELKRRATDLAHELDRKQSLLDAMNKELKERGVIDGE